MFFLSKKNNSEKKIPSQSHFNFNLEFLKPLKKQLYEVRNENEKKNMRAH
jgi:hypothetical protein